MKILLLLFVVFLSFTSCKHNNRLDDVIDWGKYPQVNLSLPKTLEFVGDELPCDANLKVIGDTCAFLKPTFLQTGEVHLYKLRNDTLIKIKEIIRKGNGPLDGGNQGIEILTLDDGGIVIGASGYNPKTFHLSADNRSFIKDLQKWELNEIPTKNYVNKILPIDSNRYLIQVTGDIPSLLAYYESGDTAFTYIPFPYPDDKYSDFTRTMAYSGIMKKRPFKEQYLYHTVGGKYLFTFTLNKSKEMNNINYIYNKPKEFKLQKDGIGLGNMTDETPIHSYVYCTQNYIYVCSSDFTWLDFINDNINDRNGGNDPWFYNKIQVFDWEGNPIKTYHLDQYVSSFIVNNNDSLLYGNVIDRNTDNVSIVKYVLN